MLNLSRRERRPVTDKAETTNIELRHVQDQQ